MLKALLQFDRLYILGAEILKIQVTSLTDVSPDKMLISGIGSGFLHDLADISSLKDGQLLTVTEGDASAIPQQWTESAAEAPTAKTGAPASTDKIYGFLPSDVQLLTPNGGTTTAGKYTCKQVYIYIYISGICIYTKIYLYIYYIYIYMYKYMHINICI